jgi:hypothetical protein
MAEWLVEKKSFASTYYTKNDNERIESLIIFSKLFTNKTLCYYTEVIIFPLILNWQREKRKEKRRNATTTKIYEKKYMYVYVCRVQTKGKSNNEPIIRPVDY